MEKRWTKKSENEKKFQEKMRKNFKRKCEKISIFAGQRAQPYAEKEQIWTSELRKLCLTAKNEKNTFKHHHEEREEHFYRTNARDR